MCLQELFERHAVDFPDRIAVKDSSGERTYQELETSANRLAHHLLHKGVLPGFAIPLSFSSSCDMILSLLAIMKCQGAYVPLDPELAPERRRMILKDVNSSWLLTEKRLSNHLVPDDVTQIVLTEEWPLLQIYPSTPPAVSVCDTDAAMILYTSGTTGRPKGVIIEHRSVINLLQGIDRVCRPWTSVPAGLSICPFSFDVSVYEFFSMLCYGGTLHFLTGPGLQDFHRLACYLADEAIQSVYLAPAMLERLVNQMETMPQAWNLQRILVGVEPIKEGVLQRYRTLLPAADILNGYGPTEATICCTVYPFLSSRNPSARTPIGKEIDGYRVHILDQEKRPVTPGELGEICIGGKGLARGYLNDLVMTEAKFIPDPFCPDGSQRLFCTGDKAFVRPDGNIVFDGRRDRQVKIRGFRIELGEVEAALQQHPCISAQAVVAAQNVRGENYLVAFCETPTGATLTPAELRSFLAECLPVSEIPSEFIFLPKMPRNRNGKVDYAVLPTLLPKHQPEPLSPKEAAIGQVWRDVLKADSINRQETFFALGGHSINAARIIEAIQERFHVLLSIKTLMENPTLETFCRLVPDEPMPTEMPNDATAESETWDRSEIDDCDRFINNPSPRAEMGSNKGYSCILIGETSLLIQCARRLQATCLDIAGIVSPNPDILNWAQTENITCHRGYRDMAAFIQSFEYDYLFSIVSSVILPADILQTARIAAINYHDSPLPRYSGMYATTWAILNGETTHAISWHIMTEKVDEGDILIQLPVVIEIQDTVHTLNTRCYEEAIHAFEQLAAQLVTGVLARQPQNMEHRSYFGLHQRPLNAGVLLWNRPTAELINLVRALTYDPMYKNPFGTPKLLLGHTWYIVRSVQAGPAQSATPAGEIIEIGSQGLRVATSDGSLLVTELADLGGIARSIPFLQKVHNLHPESRLEILDQATLASWSERQSRLARYEDFWETTLRAFFEAAPAPVLNAESQGSPVRAFVPFSASLKKRIHEAGSGFVVTAMNLYLSCLYSEPLRIGLCHEGSRDPVFAPCNWTASIVPLAQSLNRDLDPSQFRAKAREVQTLLGKETFQRDLFYRIPDFPKLTHIEYDYVICLGEECESVLLDATAHHRVLRITQDGIHLYGFAETDLPPDQFLSRGMHFLTQVMEAPWTRPDELSLLLPDEEPVADVLQEQALAADHDLPVHLLFAQQAALNSDRVAVVWEDRQWSYQELDQKANHMAQTLQAWQGRDLKMIAVCLDRSLEMIAVLLGVLKIGSAYLPLAPDIPRNRMSGILRDAGITLLITTEALAARFGVMTPACLTVESLVDCKPVSAPVPAHDMQAPAYVIYTSGSTGKPKGVVIGHRALAGFTRDCIRRYHLQPSDHILQFASLAFDAAVEEIYPCLCCGGTLVLRTEEMVRSIPALIRACSDHQITVLDLPTAFWSLLIGECETANLRLPDSIRLVIIGGESATRAMFASWKRQYAEYPVLVNTYGPTETTVVATAFEYAGHWPEPYLPIGKPVGHVQAHVINGFGQLLPSGYVGELYLGGTCLAQGYLNHAELTRQSFQEMRILKSRERLFRTGDLVQALADGNLIFIGRKDNQVKIRGFRIELDEIRCAIAVFAEVKDCVVIAYGEAAEKKLAAYVVFHNAPLSGQELRNRLAETLPDYMLPTVVIPVEVIRLTSNMKVDLKALADPSRFEHSRSTDVNEVCTLREQQIKEIWQQIMNKSHIGLDDDFFDLGGDSLTAVRMMAEIERQIGRNLPISVMFQHSTIRQLVLLIESKAEEDAWRPLVLIKKGTNRIPLFIIHGAGLTVLLFNALSRHMHPHQPVYGLQAPRLEGEGGTLYNLADIVEAYAKEIMTVNAEGPFAVAGYSIGGRIAYELAQYFVRLGKRVIFVGIFDTYAGDDEPIRQGFIYACRKATVLLKEKLGVLLRSLHHPVDAMPIRWRGLKHRLSNLVWPSRRKEHDREVAHLRETFAVLAAPMIDAVNRHTLLPYSGRIHLFKARQRLFYVADREFMGWKRYVSDIKVFDVAGVHFDIFTAPNDKTFAETLQSALDEETAAYARESNQELT